MEVAPARPVLRIEGLSVPLPAGADRSHAVKDASLHVEAGEVVCLVGESGSGKSIIARSVMGLLPPLTFPRIEGRIRLGDTDLLGLPPAERRAISGQRLSMIFQEPMTALNPVMSVGRQIEEVLLIHARSMTKAARRDAVMKMLDSVSLPDPASLFAAYPSQLSGGQRQRVMIAMALIMNPALVIADEPTTALDVTTQAQILRLIRDLQRRQGTGVLFITHDIGVVADIADRVVVLQNGCIVEEGARDAVLQTPKFDYTRALIASVPSLEPPKRKSRGHGAQVVLEVNGLSKTYDRGGLFHRGRPVAAVKPLSLSIARGEVVTVVGESGSGKTTLARCIAGLIAPTLGSVRISSQSPSRGVAGCEVQMVFQDPSRSLNPRLTVGMSIIEGPRNRGETTATARALARELVTLVGLSPDSLERYPHQFSGGQRQRLCIARALAMKPELLVADEAVSALDVSVQRQVLELLESIRSRLNLAILFITHDLRVAAHISDRILVMSGGELVEQGSALQVLMEPRHPYTTSLLASVAGRDYPFARAVAK